MTRLEPGTSGYAYRGWRGALYPAKLPEREFLGHYAQVFRTVEINSSFYRLPTAAQLATMAAQAPAGFTFAFKAPQTITHHKRLRDVEGLIDELFAVLGGLGDQLGPVLFGLPPNLPVDLPLLADALAACPQGRRVAVEFRHQSWLGEGTYQLLADAQVALCVADTPDLTTPTVATTDWSYARLRRDDYDDAALGAFASALTGTGATWAPIYFKHDDHGHAAVLARRLAALLAAA